VNCVDLKMHGAMTIKKKKIGVCLATVNKLYYFAHQSL